MNRTRSWLEGLLGLLLGLSLGLAISWWLAPNGVLDQTPAAMQSKYQDEYRLLVAHAFAATGDVGRAQARLALLGPSDPVPALLDLAFRLRAAQSASTIYPADPERSVTLLASLANAIQNAGTTSNTLPDSTLPPASSSPTPTLAPFLLLSQETICDPTLTPGLLKIVVLDQRGRAVPGVEIRLSWQGGQQRVFTGFKPELGLGYADIILTPGVEYSLQVWPNSPPISGLIVPVCSTGEEDSYPGAVGLIFAQP